MQQTSKYQFKLIEGTDKFLPDPLNQNVQKTENLLAGLEGDLVDGLSQMLAAMGSGGQTCRIATGSYTGTGTHNEDNPRALTFAFFPRLVIISGTDKNGVITCTYPRDRTLNAYGYNGVLYLTWDGGTLSWYGNDSGSEYHLDDEGRVYYYVALGCADPED